MQLDQQTRPGCVRYWIPELLWSVVESPLGIDTCQLGTMNLKVPACILQYVLHSLRDIHTRLTLAAISPIAKSAPVFTSGNSTARRPEKSCLSYSCH